MMAVTTIQTGGNRVARVGSYHNIPGNGDPPELRVFIASGWADTPPLPVGAVVDIPATALPELLAVLERIGEAS